jgi:hypothetical protein
MPRQLFGALADHALITAMKQGGVDSGGRSG